MRKNNTLIVMTVILGILVVVLGGYIVYDKYIKMEVLESDNNDINTIKYTYDDVKGLYKYTSDLMTDENGSEFKAWYNLYLYENGTFNYSMGTFGPFGYMGNYIIEDNKIVLNYLFSTNSGAGINVVSGVQELIINENDTLTDTAQNIKAIDLSSVVLAKASLEEENEYLKGNDFSYILNNYEIVNSSN